MRKLKLTARAQHSVSSIPCEDTTPTNTMEETPISTEGMEELKLDPTTEESLTQEQHPSGDVEKSYNNLMYCIHEKDTMEPYFFHPNFLIYQGRQHTLAEIAPVFKKDCRTWLWKSVSNARKQKKLNKF